MNPALSTCWNSRRHTCGRAMVEEMLSLGFRTIEISHGIHAPMLEGILVAKDRHRFEVCSVHNFLPMPVEILGDAPDCYEFSSHRPSDRARAMKLTRQTIDWAERLGARFVVVHTGRVPHRLGDPLREMVTEGGLWSRRFCRAKLDAVKRREASAETVRLRVVECVAELADYAGKKGVRLGIENREDYEAFPSEREFGAFLAQLDSAHVGYWHDFGHAQIKHQLGLLDHGKWLERFGSKALGSHVHDVIWPCRDHRAPFTGEIDFARLVQLLPESCQFVFELSPRVSKEDLGAALARWRELF